MTVDAPRAPDDADGAGSGAHDAPSSPEAPPGRSSQCARLAAAVVVVALLTMWGYVLYLAFGPGRQPPVDRIDDPAFAQVAEERCAAALAEIGDLPLASESPDAEARADVLDEANALYGSLIDELDGLTMLVPDDAQRRNLEEWIADWRTHLDDRDAYADALRTDPDARLLVSEKAGEGRHITGWIDEFALANRMPSCASPTDA